MHSDTKGFVGNSFNLLCSINHSIVGFCSFFGAWCAKINTTNELAHNYKIYSRNHLRLQCACF